MNGQMTINELLMLLGEKEATIYQLRRDLTAALAAADAAKPIADASQK